VHFDPQLSHVRFFPEKKMSRSSIVVGLELKEYSRPNGGVGKFRLVSIDQECNGKVFKKNFAARYVHFFHFFPQFFCGDVAGELTLAQSGSRVIFSAGRLLSFLNR